MIQEAHVGIGLYGKEGMSAVQSSDYALPEFKCLWRMLMCHGRWSYIRNAEMIIYFFYKNMVFSLPLLIWSFYTGFSGQTVYDDFYITFYNLAFTSWPLLVKALFDKDFDHKFWPVKKSHHMCGPERIGKLETDKTFVEWMPYLYYIGQQNMIYNIKNLAYTLIYSVAVGTFMMFVIIYSVQSCMSNIDGFTTDIWYMSLVLYTAILLVVDFKMVIITKSWTWLNVVALTLFSIFLYLPYVFIADTLPEIFY
jgi:magnesium-transporting ATPase (P-type)